MFNPKLSIGQIIKNSDLHDIFGCGHMGGMRRSTKTNTLVIVSDYTKGLYHDKWIGEVLHYTGMGKNGDQDINRAQNATLANCMTNGVDVHLFEVINEGEYIYCGRIELVEKPYTEMQPGEDGGMRKVWMFPIRPVPENDVQKPEMFVFKDIEDYKSHGKDVDAKYQRMMSANKKRSNKIINKPPTVVEIKKVPQIEIPQDIVHRRIKHKSFGLGTITGIEGQMIIIDFDNFGIKKMGYEFCIKNKMFEFK